MHNSFNGQLNGKASTTAQQKKKDSYRNGTVIHIAATTSWHTATVTASHLVISEDRNRAVIGKAIVHP